MDVGVLVGGMICNFIFFYPYIKIIERKLKELELVKI